MASAPRWQDWTSFALGLCLALSPWLLGYSADDGATANAAICGLALALTAHFGASCCEDGAAWLDLAIGLWLLGAPFVIGMDALSLQSATSLAVGALATALAASTLHLEKDIARWVHR